MAGPPYLSAQEDKQMDIQNASVLITGGSRGLGRELAIGLAAEGASVVLVARGLEELNQAVEEIRSNGGNAHAIIADVGDKNAIHSIAAQAAALAGPIDLLIQNASALGPVPLRLLLDTDCEDLDRALEVNLVGPFRLAKVLVGPMVLRGAGLVLSITSDASVQAYPEWGVYSVTKAALDHMNRLFASELLDTGVQFLCVDPGDMDTAMHAAALPDADRSKLQKPEDAARRLLEIIRHAGAFPNGSRLVASELEVPQ
jgi:NAD(P)-dependent dehydrogenase (short-subunit alcohol dehydrogenase family)